MNPSFNKDVLKLDMNGIVKLALIDKPVSLFKSFKLSEEKTINVFICAVINFIVLVHQMFQK